MTSSLSFQNDWWVSKHLKKPIRSTVNCIDWHPNNVLIAVGSTDYRCRVFGTYIKGVDVKVKDLPPTCWGKKLKFGELLGDYGTGASTGWIHDVSFDDSGDKIAYVKTGNKGKKKKTQPFLPRICSRTLMGCFVPTGAVACCSRYLLTRALS